MVGGGQGRGKPDSGCVSGWREEVAPQQKTAVFWHSVWMSAGRPNTGQLFEIVKRTRNQFPYACRRVRKEAYTIKSQKLFEASLWGGADLFDELKKTREAGTDRISHAGANWEEEISLKFQQVYCSLYNLAIKDQEMVVIKPVLPKTVYQKYSESSSNYNEQGKGRCI